MQDQINTPATSYCLLSVKQVKEIVSLSVSTIWARVKQGTFPQPRKLGDKITRWKSTDVQQWMDEITGGEVQQ